MVHNVSDVTDKLRKGEINRQYAKTYMNHKSSRSHTIFRLKVKSVTFLEGIEKTTESVMVIPILTVELRRFGGKRKT